MRNALLLWALASVAAPGCDKTVDGVSPVGGEVTSPAEVERFVRRAHLDLTGGAAEEAFVEQARDQILAAGNTAPVRGEVVDDLLADTRFAETFVDEVENRTFAAEGYEPGFNLICGVTRMNDAACAGCQASADPCSGCTCASITGLLAEREALEAAAADLDRGDATTSEVERRFAEATPYIALAGPDAGANNLFEDFLGRPAEADELQNARAMILAIGVDQTNPNAAQNAGLLFHRLGGTQGDLLDIVFASEVYREAAVNRVFERFIGRRATPAELDHFVATLDPDNPDVREVTRAVVSSREYFGQ